MILKGFSTQLDMRLLRLLFSDDHPDFMNDKNPYLAEVKWLAWHALLTKSEGELTDWLLGITSQGFQSQMRYYLNQCIAWGWLMQHDRKQIQKMVNVLDAAENHQMREHLNYLKPYYRYWKLRQIQQQIDKQAAA